MMWEEVVHRGCYVRRLFHKHTTFSLISFSNADAGVCTVSPWASYGELHEVEQRLARVKADLISELVAVRLSQSIPTSLAGALRCKSWLTGNFISGEIVCCVARDVALVHRSRSCVPSSMPHKR